MVDKTMQKAAVFVAESKFIRNDQGVVYIKKASTTLTDGAVRSKAIVAV